MQEIRTADEASQVISNLYARGAIDETVISEPQMQQTIARILAMPEVAPWFRHGLQVLNELTIMNTQGEQERPDRIVITPDGHAIVIDFKTGSPRAKHVEQVQYYMRLLNEIGYNNVKGYLWYLRTNTVRAV